MNAEAKLKTEEGEEGDGLSMLDVVKHGVKTVMGVLQPTDRLAIVQYASRAKVVHRLRNMSADGKTVQNDVDICFDPHCVAQPTSLPQCLHPAACSTRHAERRHLLLALLGPNLKLGLQVSTELVDALKPSGTTNLWDGLKTGLEVLREDSEPSRTQSIFLLTDGVPNIEPPRILDLGLDF